MAPSRWYALAFLALAAACSSAGLTESAPRPGAADGECTDDNPNCQSADPTSPDGDGGTREGGAVSASSGVSIQVQPSDNGAALLSAIRGAKSSIHMTMYLLSNNAMIDALGDMKEAGKDVKVVLNRTFPPNGGDNQNAFEKLAARGVEVHWAPSTYTYTHAKTIIIDGAQVIIMTMNLTFSSPATNREYIATDTDPRDVADAEKIFEADFANEPISIASKLVISPTAANSNGSPRDQLRALIDSAQDTLDVEVQSLSDSTLVDAIVRAHQAGVAVHVVIDGDTATSTSEKKVITKLKDAGVPLRSLKDPDLHAKVVVADDRAFVGSQNFTSTALSQNREVGVITGAKAEVGKVRAQIASDFEAGTAL